MAHGFGLHDLDLQRVELRLLPRHPRQRLLHLLAVTHNRRFSVPLQFKDVLLYLIETAFAERFHQQLSLQGLQHSVKLLEPGRVDLQVTQVDFAAIFEHVDPL
jgi:hypothetical protein